MLRRVLEGDSEVVAGWLFGEVDLHTGVDITIVCPVSLHLIGDELECFTHTVLCHFLFGLFQLLEFAQEDHERFLELLGVFSQSSTFLY